MRPFLSLCMIVKNEQKFLKRCLNSINGLVDEIIIVDTGSDDCTKEIASEFTSLVYDYNWENDFSKARNYAAGKAKGEWIIVLDADEFVDRVSFEKFTIELKESLIDSNIMAIQIVNFIGENGVETVLNYHERIYKNDGKIMYYRNVHEMLIHSDSLEKRGFANLQIYHSGYMTSVREEKNKSQRNLKLLKQKKEKEAIDYYFLGNEYSALGELSKAIDYYKKGYQLKNDIHHEWVSKLLVKLVQCLHDEKRYTEALEIIIPCEEVFISQVDFKYLKGRIFAVQQKNVEAIEVFEKILFQKDKLVADSSTDYLEYLPHKHLGELYEKENKIQLAVQHYSNALSLNESDDFIWMRLINLLSQHTVIVC